MRDKSSLIHSTLLAGAAILILCCTAPSNLFSFNLDATSSRENPATSTPAIRQPDGTSRAGPEQQTPQRVQPEDEEEKDFSPLIEREPPGAAENDEQHLKMLMVMSLKI